MFFSIFCTIIYLYREKNNTYVSIIWRRLSGINNNVLKFPVPEQITFIDVQCTYINNYTAIPADTIMGPYYTLPTIKKKLHVIIISIQLFNRCGTIVEERVFNYYIEVYICDV